MERLYWERHSANHAVYPDPGAQLDQDEQLMTDLGTYGWLVGFAENILDQEDAVRDAMRKANQG